MNLVRHDGSTAGAGKATGFLLQSPPGPWLAATGSAGSEPAGLTPQPVSEGCRLFKTRVWFYWTAMGAETRLMAAQSRRNGVVFARQPPDTDQAVFKRNLSCKLAVSTQCLSKVASLAAAPCCAAGGSAAALARSPRVASQLSLLRRALRRAVGSSSSRSSASVCWNHPHMSSCL